MKKHQYENEEDRKLIRDKIEEENITASEKLSEDRIRAMLSAEAENMTAEDASAGVDPEGKQVFRLNRRLRPLIAVAACAVVIVAVGTTAHFVNRSGSDAEQNLSETASAGDEAEETTDAAEGLVTFSDYSEIEKKMEELLPDELTGYDGIRDYAVNKGTETIGAQEDIAAAEGSAEVIQSNGSAAKSAAPAASGGHSETYEQVEGVSEADIIKTDGSYIYYVDEEGYNIHIVAAGNGKTKEVATITDNEDFTYYSDLYIGKDRLVVLGMSGSDAAAEDTAAVIVYDIADRRNPKKESVYRQSGRILSSRMIGNHVYLITSDYIYDRHRRYVPYATSEGSYRKIPATDICACPQYESTNYIVAGAVDITSGDKAKTSTKAILGGSETIYCNLENLYVTATDYRSYLMYNDAIVKNGAAVAEEEAEESLSVKNGEELNEDTYTEKTLVIRMELKDGTIRVKASGKVPGRVLNQFSMDEKDGYLRIATTAWKDKSGYDVNNLYILDQNLKQVSSMTGFAKTEQIKAVRYIGEKAYVITYEQTDPLFILDLSDPEHPVMEGNVKISGFSTLLVPADDKTLLGFGFSTESTEFGEATDGLKLVTFDISDSAKPKVADSVSFAGYESEIQYDHRALIVNGEKGYYAIPYENYSNDAYDENEEGGIDSGVLVIAVTKDQKIDLIRRFRADVKEEVSRCVFIGDWIYALHPFSGTFSAFQL